MSFIIDLFSSAYHIAYAFSIVWKHDHWSLHYFQILHMLAFYILLSISGMHRFFIVFEKDMFMSLCISVISIGAQNCSTLPAYARCSTNNECGCVPILHATEPVCALFPPSCPDLPRCGGLNQDICFLTGEVCIRFDPCFPAPVCYPTSMANLDACPPLLPALNTTTNSMITTTVSSNHTGIGKENSKNLTSNLFLIAWSIYLAILNDP